MCGTLDVSDVEIVETEQRTRAAVALCVDTSWSMVADGRWVPMKRTALALHHLVSTRFRGDALQLITFGRHAKEVELGELTALEGAWEQGTNLHHALLLAGRHLRRTSDAAPVVLVVTDGEPTAHLEPDGHAGVRLPAEPGDAAGDAERGRRAGAPARGDDGLHPRRGPAPGGVRRPRRPTGGRPGRRPGPGRSRGGRGERLPGESPDDAEAIRTTARIHPHGATPRVR